MLLIQYKLKYRYLTKPILSIQNTHNMENYLDNVLKIVSMRY